jgi:Ner family transcriptional regulator
MRRSSQKQGWHPEDIKAAVRKKDTNLARLSLAGGLPEHACRAAFRNPYPAAERLIADLLGVHPMAIWPDRYTPSGETRHPPRVHFLHSNAANPPTHCQKTEAA